jgi:hypothetical protein
VSANVRLAPREVAILGRGPGENSFGHSGAAPAGATIQRMTTDAFVEDADLLNAHLEQVIPPDQRHRSSVWFIVCDIDRGEVSGHYPVDDVPPGLGMAECVEMVEVFIDSEPPDVNIALLVVLTRRGPASVTQDDKQWFRAVTQVCSERKVRLLGVRLMTPSVMKEVVLDDM